LELTEISEWVPLFTSEDEALKTLESTRASVSES
jgi:hypothetical protein